MNKNKVLSIAVLIFLIPGCMIPEPAKRVGKHVARDTYHVLQKHPEDETAKRAAKGAMALSTFLGQPEKKVYPAQLDDDIKKLESVTSFWGRLLEAMPDWSLTALKYIGGLSTVVIAAWGGNHFGAARGLISIFTNAIEKHGNGKIKKEIHKATRGTRLAKLVEKNVVKAEAANGKPKST